MYDEYTGVQDCALRALYIVRKNAWCLKCTDSLWSVNYDTETPCPKAVLQLWILRFWIIFVSCWIFSLLFFLHFGLEIVAVLFKIDYSISSGNHLFAGDWIPLPVDESCSSESQKSSRRNRIQLSHVMVMTREQSLNIGDVLLYQVKMTSRGPIL